MQGLRIWMACWGGVLVGSKIAGIAGGRVSGWQGIIFMEGFLSTWRRVSRASGRHGLGTGGFLECRVCGGA